MVRVWIFSNSWQLSSSSIFLKSHLWIRRYISISSSEWKWTFKWYQWNGVPLYEGENLVNGLLKAVIKFFIGPCIFMEQIFGPNWSVLHLSSGDYRIDLPDSLQIEIRDECLPLFSRGRCFNPI